LFTVAVSLPLAALNVYFRDTRYLVQVGLLAWMYLTPVFYPVDIVPERYRWVFDINPMSVITNAYRQVIFVGGSPEVLHLLVAACLSAAVFVFGYWMFRRMGHGFADVV
jgi:lipopolysaccharide transport system permease protein